MIMARVLSLLLSVCALANGYGISDNGKGNNNTRTNIPHMNPKQQTDGLHSTKSAVENRQLTTGSPIPKDSDINSNKLKLEILELQKMQDSLLTDMASGQTTARKQRLLQEIEQQIQVRMSRQKRLEATVAPQLSLTTKKQQSNIKEHKQQQEQLHQQLQQSQQQKQSQQQTPPLQNVHQQNQNQQPQQFQQQVKQQQQNQPILTRQQTNIIQHTDPVMNQHIKLSDNAHNFGTQVAAGRQPIQQNSQMLQPQQYPPSLQIPPLIPQNFVPPHLLNQQNNSILAQSNTLPMRQILVPINSLALSQVLQGQNQRYFVLGSGSNVVDSSLHMSEFVNPSVKVLARDSSKSQTTTVAPTTKTTLRPTTAETTVSTTTTAETTTTDSLDENNQAPMVDMNYLRQSYYEDSVTKQRLEIQKLRLEIRALNRDERQSMGGENENEDAPRRNMFGSMRNMFGSRRMPFMPMLR